MTRRTLLFRSLRYHIRAHLGVVLGAAVGSAALVGALIVGDSVRGSLKEMALARLGKTQLALIGNDRLFRAGLAADWQNALNTPTAPVLMLPASAAQSDGRARANQVQLLGVDERFWTFAQTPPAFASSPFTNGAVINTTLARQLEIGPGDTILLRAEKPSLLSRDAPITPQQEYSTALRLPVAAVVDDAALGRFGLHANQVPPFNAFVPLALLQERAETPGRANVILVGHGNGPVDVSRARESLRQAWKLADAQLEVRALTNSQGLELTSERIFLDRPVLRAAADVVPGAQPVLTYFVHELRVGERTTPYSMVAGVEEPLLPPDMSDDAIAINSWLAEDLGATPGDEMTLTYYVVGTGQRLVLAQSVFTVRSVIPLAGPAADPQLMPEFPGVAEAESTHNWDAGFPIDNNKIRDKDEDYWKAHRGTPKAFVTLAAAQRMWSSRFGEATAVRFNDSQAEGLAEKLARALDPAQLGLKVEPVRDQALAASSQSMDFGQLFLGFSFFLIVAALVLMALLFEFGLEQRAGETGTFLALGFRPGQVRRLLLLEGTALAFAGGLIGLAGGAGYARAMLYGLTTVWSEAVASSALEYHARPLTYVIGLFSSVMVCALTIAWVLRKQARRPARELLDEGNIEPPVPARARSRWPALVGTVALLAALAICVAGRDKAASAFFSAGGLLLVAGLAWTIVLLRRAEDSAAGRHLSLLSLGLRNAARRRRRSLATITLLACGSFIVAAIGANKLEANRDAAKRSSGTGGFALIGQSTLPVSHDLNLPEGQEFYGLDPQDLEGVAVVPFRVRDGDDASCLNLNRAQRPRLLGVRPEELHRRGAFTFAKVMPGIEDPWLGLNDALPDGTIPAIGDLASIQWALGKKIGDTISYEDDRGNGFQVRLIGGLANSIMQGNLIISESHFLDKFPSESGYRMFLVDAPSKEEVSSTLSRALQDAGLELTPAPDRLAAFNAVQNTYLNTFQVLGGLGLLLGSAGLGVVVLRNVLERRAELAVLQAVGFRRGRLRALILTEHAGLLVGGLAVGIVAALLAVAPVLMAPGADVQILALLATLCGVLTSGLVWTLLATGFALRGELLPALRNE